MIKLRARRLFANNDLLGTEHLRTHANQYEYVCDGPDSCGERFNTRHYLLSHQKHCHHGAYAITG